MKEFEFKLNEEALQALFQGKKVEILMYGIKFTILPPRFGVFMTHEKYAELENLIYSRAFDEMTNLLKGIKENDSFNQRI